MASLHALAVFYRLDVALHSCESDCVPGGEVGDFSSSAKPAPTALAAVPTAAVPSSGAPSPAAGLARRIASRRRWLAALSLGLAGLELWAG